MKVLLTTTSFQDTPGKHHELLNSQNWEIDTLRGPVDEDVLLPIIHQYDGVICGDDEYSKKVLEKGKSGRLKVVSKYGVGLDRIDLSAAKELGITVTNCPGVNQISVAEHVIGLLFTFQKNIHLQYNSVQKKSWKRLIGSEVQGSTIGIIGLGSVGKELAKKSLALGMRVYAFDLRKDEEFLKEFPEIVFVEDLDQIYAIVDIISLHLPHNKHTDKMINQEVFNKMVQNPIIVNTSRGKLIDIDALIIALDKGQVKGYLTDVLASEPIQNDEKLVGLDNVIITPHVGSRTYQSVERQGSMAINNLIESIK